MFPIFVVLSFSSVCQSHGYLGKKSTLSFNTTGAIPVFYRYRTGGQPNYKKSGSGLKNGNDQFDMGINIALSHAFSGKFGMGFDYAMLFGNVKAPTNGYYSNYDSNGNGNGYSLNIMHEQLSIQTQVFMPKIEYTMLGSELPLGINNQFGIGFTSTKVVEKDYISIIDLPNYINPIDSAAILNQETINYAKVQSINGLTIMYAFNIRTPISKNFMINYGIRYNLNLTFDPAKHNSNFYKSSDIVNYLYDPSTVISAVQSKRIASIISLNLGLTYVF